MEEENRENVFTQFARDINSFACHNINKEQLFERFVDMIEMCSENEKQERGKCIVELKEYNEKDLLEHLTGAIKKPYFNYDRAKELLTGV